MEKKLERTYYSSSAKWIIAFTDHSCSQSRGTYSIYICYLSGLHSKRQYFWPLRIWTIKMYWFITQHCFRQPGFSSWVGMYPVPLPNIHKFRLKLYLRVLLPMSKLLWGCCQSNLWGKLVTALLFTVASILVLIFISGSRLTLSFLNRSSTWAFLFEATVYSNSLPQSRNV